MSTENKKMLTLMSSDNQEFEIEEAVAVQAETIKAMVEDGCAENAIPLPNVKGTILAKVIEYLKMHVDDDKESKTKDDEETLKNFDKDFVKVDRAILFELILAANYLNIKGLLDMTCQRVADMIKEKSPEEIREILKIKNDLTPEEEEQARKENQWAFE